MLFEIRKVTGSYAAWGAWLKGHAQRSSSKCRPSLEASSYRGSTLPQTSMETQIALFKRTVVLIAHFWVSMLVPRSVVPAITPIQTWMFDVDGLARDSPTTAFLAFERSCIISVLPSCVPDSILKLHFVFYTTSIW